MPRQRFMACGEPRMPRKSLAWPAQKPRRPRTSFAWHAASTACHARFLRGLRRKFCMPRKTFARPPARSRKPRKSLAWLPAKSRKPRQRFAWLPAGPGSHAKLLRGFLDFSEATRGFLDFAEATQDKAVVSAFLRSHGRFGVSFSVQCWTVRGSRVLGVSQDATLRAWRHIPEVLWCCA